MKPGRRIALAVFSYIALFASMPVALAADKIVSRTALQALFEFHIPRDQGPLSDSAERVRFAKAISAVCRSYRGIVRTITPDEEAWLDKEFGADSSPERALAALGTEISSRSQSARFLDSCISTSGRIATAEDHPVIWASLARLLVAEDITDALKHVGAANADAEDIQRANFFFRETAVTIIGRIVIPALRE